MYKSTNAVIIVRFFCLNANHRRPNALYLSAVRTIRRKRCI